MPENLDLNSRRQLAVDGLGALPAGGTSKVANATEKMKDALRKYDLNLSSGRRGADDIIGETNKTVGVTDSKANLEKPTEFDKKTYKRPSGYRKGVRDEVWDNAKDSDGIVRDPLTQKPLNVDEPWDMGHKPGYEFKKHQQSAAEREISRKQFLDEHNNPSHYRPELPSSNRSHAGEDVTNKYFGP